MTASISDIQLGADLVIKAIGDDVKGFLTRSEDESSAQFRDNATKDLRALSIWQIDNKILTTDEDTNYVINEQAINGLSDAKVQEGGALYQAAVDSQMPLMTDMFLAGKTQYVDYFSDVHRPVQLDMLQPEARISEDSLDAVAKAALTLTESAYRDPTGVDSLTGINASDITQLNEALYDAGYLVAGENEERKAPLSEQSPRGDFEQKMAIFNSASSISTNLDLPETVTGLNTVVLSAKQLQTAVGEAQTEEYMSERDGPGISELTPVNSDLQKEDVGAVYMTMLVGAMAARKAQISTDMADFDEENPMVVIPASYSVKDAKGNVTHENDIVETLGAHVAYLEDTGVIDVISRGATPKTSADFAVPGLAPTDNQLPHVAATMKRFINAAKGIAQYVHDEDERIDGDAGGRALGGPHAGAEELEEGNDDNFDQDIDLSDVDGDTGLSSTMDSPAMDGLDPVERKVPERLVDNMAKALDELDSMGVLRRMGEMVGRDEKFDDQAIFSEGQGGVYGSLEDFVQSDESTMDPSNREYKTDTYSKSQIMRLGVDKAEALKRQGAVTITPGRGFLEGASYASGAASVAHRRVRDFVNANLTTEENKPNVPLRAALRRMAERPVIASTEVEAKAWKDVGQQFVEREAEEHKLRLEAAEEKAGLWTMDASRAQLRRALTVAQASGDDAPFKVVITDQSAFMMRSDAPKISLDPKEGIPEAITNTKVARDLGGMLKIEAIQGALDNMEQHETVAKIAMTGERPRGVTSQVMTQREREMEATRNKKSKGIESHLPDVLS